LPNNRVLLWHVPSGPLPLLGENGVLGWVSSPSEGWTELRSGADNTVPYFGPGHPGIFALTTRIESQRSCAIGLSTIEWIGNWYKVLGDSASPQTERYWRRLKRYVASSGKLITRAGATDGPKPDAYAFPSALRQILAGRSRAVTPR
jgi:hypothetical protein